MAGIQRERHTAVEHEASEWVTRLHGEDVSANDLRRFDTWRTADPAHARAYADLDATWHRFEVAAPLLAVRFDQARNEAVTTRTRGGLRALAVLAVAAVFCVAVWIHMARLTSRTVFQTAVGQHAAFRLPDGSSIELNSNSLARVDYSTTARVIYLDRGEAFCAVAHDIQRPFWVVGGGAWVRAVGTAFNVYVRPVGVRVTVSEGIIKLAHLGEVVDREPSNSLLAQLPMLELAAGQQVDVRGPSTVLRTLGPAELTRSFSWRSGFVHFENQPLSEVAEDLGRYTTVHIVLKDAKARDTLVGGTFQTNQQGAEEFISMLRTGLGYGVYRESGFVYIWSGPADLSN
jgi:transmembrane sensor